LTFQPDATPPSAPANLTAQPAGASIALAWQAATDDRAVTSYNIHRSTTATFTPTDTTYVGSTSGRTFTDTPPAGTWYYRVVAEDAAGNRSAASSPATSTAAAGSTTAVVTPTADAYANAAMPATNYGTSASLLSNGSPAGASYLRFVLPTAPAGESLTSAILQIWTTSDTSAGSTVAHSVTLGSDAWDEATLCWSNRPAVGTTVLGSIPAGTMKSTVYTVPLDVSALRSQLGLQTTIAATSTASDGLWFWSRDRGATYQPRLTLTFS